MFTTAVKESVKLVNVAFKRTHKNIPIFSDREE